MTIEKRCVNFTDMCQFVSDIYMILIKHAGHIAEACAASARDSRGV